MSDTELLEHAADEYIASVADVPLPFAAIRVGRSAFIAGAKWERGQEANSAQDDRKAEIAFLTLQWRERGQTDEDIAAMFDYPVEEVRAVRGIG